MRYPNVYGPKQNPHGEACVVAIFTEQLLDDKQSIVFGDGTKTIDYVGDLVNANMSAMFNEADLSGEIHSLGWGKERYRNLLNRQGGLSVDPLFGEKRPGEIDLTA